MSTVRVDRVFGRAFAALPLAARFQARIRTHHRFTSTGYSVGIQDPSRTAPG
jgi:hypothetical protein